MRQTSLKTVYDLATQDQRVVFIGSDLGPGTQNEFMEHMPDRFFMEGVSEANIIGMAAGLAMDGFIPYVNTIATFLTRRCFEQISMDLCLHNLPVRLIGNGGGLVYAPLGPTHIAIDDIALMRSQPNMTVIAPADHTEMYELMLKTLNWPGPIYVRLGKGGDPIIPRRSATSEIGKGVVIRSSKEIIIIASGVMTNRALKASDLLKADGICCGVLHFPTIKPLDTKLLLEQTKNSRMIVTLDEHLIIGGLGSAVMESLNDELDGPVPKVHRLGIRDQFTKNYGSQDDLMEHFQLQPKQIMKYIQRFVGRIPNA